MSSMRSASVAGGLQPFALSEGAELKAVERHTLCPFHSYPCVGPSPEETTQNAHSTISELKACAILIVVLYGEPGRHLHLVPSTTRRFPAVRSSMRPYLNSLSSPHSLKRDALVASRIASGFTDLRNSRTRRHTPCRACRAVWVERLGGAMLQAVQKIWAVGAGWKPSRQGTPAAGRRKSATKCGGWESLLGSGAAGCRAHAATARRRAFVGEAGGSSSTDNGVCVGRGGQNQMNEANGGERNGEGCAKTAAGRGGADKVGRGGAHTAEGQQQQGGQGAPRYCLPQRRVADGAQAAPRGAGIERQPAGRLCAVPLLRLSGSASLLPLGGAHLSQVHHALGVAPLVVVPGHHLGGRREGGGVEWEGELRGEERAATRPKQALTGKHHQPSSWLAGPRLGRAC